MGVIRTNPTANMVQLPPQSAMMVQSGMQPMMGPMGMPPPMGPFGFPGFLSSDAADAMDPMDRDHPCSDGMGPGCGAPPMMGAVQTVSTTTNRKISRVGGNGVAPVVASFPVNGRLRMQPQTSQVVTIQHPVHQHQMVQQPTMVRTATPAVQVVRRVVQPAVQTVQTQPQVVMQPSTRMVVRQTISQPQPQMMVPAQPAPMMVAQPAPMGGVPMSPLVPQQVQAGVNTVAAANGGMFPPGDYSVSGPGYSVTKDGSDVSVDLSG